MIASMREQEEPNSGSKVNMTDANHPSKSGSQTPRLTTSSVTAGDERVSPRQFTAEDVVELAARAVSDLHDRGRVTRAAGVSAHMRRLEPTFSLEVTPFSTFREVVEATVAAGLITSRRGADDVELRPAGPTTARVRLGSTLRRDLWRAFVNWNPEVTYSYDRRSRLTGIATDPLPEGVVTVSAPSREQRIDWMRQFASDLPDSDTKDALEAGLRTEDPAAGFNAAVREVPTVERRWKKSFRANTLAAANCTDLDRC